MSAFVLKWRIAAVLSAAAVTACSVADSLHVDPAAIQASAFSPVVPTLCQSALGSYALPKSFLRVVVSQSGATPVELKATRIIRADKSRTFCFDHIVDPMADDEIRVIKSSGQLDKSYLADPKNPKPGELIPSEFIEDTKIDGNKDYGSQLLQWVVSNTVDQSEYIAKVLVRTAFIALSGKSDFTPLGRADQKGTAPPKVNLAVLEYDPFDPEESARHNERLRDFGYCLVLENFTFDTRRMTVEQYCAAPRHVSFPYEQAYAEYRAGPPPRIAGVAYRPRIDYALSVYKRDNSKGRGAWRLFQQHRFAFENIAPIVSIGLTRSVFAARRVALKFNMGTLEAMCLVKTSELQSAVAVPYEIVKSIVALPSQIFEVKIGNVSDNIDLLTAEKKVILAQKEYLEFLTNETSKTFTNSVPKAVDPLETKDKKLPDPRAVTFGFSRATLEDLQSSVLDQICRNAPSVFRAGG